eukprot:12644722-Alexandrium_andersonii.AAC.1
MCIRDRVACFDLAKAFDYLNRGLLYGLLARAGCPAGVLRAYRAFLEGMVVHIQVPNHVGPAH